MLKKNKCIVSLCIYCNKYISPLFINHPFSKGNQLKVFILLAGQDGEGHGGGHGPGDQPNRQGDRHHGTLQ